MVGFTDTRLLIILDHFRSGSDDTSVYVDVDTRIQILENMLHLPNAEKEQRAAFIVSSMLLLSPASTQLTVQNLKRDERVLVVWSDSIETIIPICNDFEARLIKVRHLSTLLCL